MPAMEEIKKQYPEIVVIIKTDLNEASHERVEYLVSKGVDGIKKTPREVYWKIIPQKIKELNKETVVE